LSQFATIDTPNPNITLPGTQSQAQLQHSDRQQKVLAELLTLEPMIDRVLLYATIQLLATTFLLKSCINASGMKQYYPTAIGDRLARLGVI